MVSVMGSPSDRRLELRSNSAPVSAGSLRRSRRGARDVREDESWRNGGRRTGRRVARGELRTEPAREPGDDEVLVRAIVSGVSRGTELLVHANAVPIEVADVMRAPFAEGEFPFPIKYGYLSVGVVEAGPSELLGRRVFCLYPHQDRYVVPIAAVTPVPDQVPSERAVLAGAVETAINALWDAGPRLGYNIAVIGAGMIGGALARLLSTFPLARLQLIDVNQDRARLGGGSMSSSPSAEAAGDWTSSPLLGQRVRSGHGPVSVGFRGRADRALLVGDARPGSLGGAFHARRLSIRASQVGVVSPSRGRGGRRGRLRPALDQLGDPGYDVLLTGRRILRPPARWRR